MMVKNNLFFLSLLVNFTVPTWVSFITIGITGIASQYQFQMIMRLCHLLVIWSITLKPMTGYFPFVQNLLNLKTRRGLDAKPFHFTKGEAISHEESVITQGHPA